jgi:hypothetical protein
MKYGNRHIEWRGIVGNRKVSILGAVSDLISSNGELGGRDCNDWLYSLCRIMKMCMVYGVHLCVVEVADDSAPRVVGNVAIDIVRSYPKAWTSNPKRAW